MSSDVLILALSEQLCECSLPVDRNAGLKQNGSAVDKDFHNYGQRKTTPLYALKYNLSIWRQNYFLKTKDELCNPICVDSTL